MLFELQLERTFEIDRSSQWYRNTRLGCYNNINANKSPLTLENDPKRLTHGYVANVGDANVQDGRIKSPWIFEKTKQNKRTRDLTFIGPNKSSDVVSGLGRK